MFKIKANDRKPSIQSVLGFEDPTGESDPGAPDLTGTTVSFIMRKATKSKKPAAGAPAINASAVVVSVAPPTVRYDWKEGDTGTPGLYLAEWEAKDANGLTQTFPTDSYIEITIYADLDEAD